MAPAQLTKAMLAEVSQAGSGSFRGVERWLISNNAEPTMVLHAMYVHDNDAEKSIGFEVNLQAPTALTHLKFIQYVEVKFDGERQDVSRTVREEHHRFGTTSVRFPESTFTEAKAFCDAKLMDNGSPHAEFHHELEHADLSEEVDKDLLWEMEGVPNNPYRLAKA